MKTLISKSTVMGFLTAMLMSTLLLTAPSQAQVSIFVENFSFEEPGTVKQLNFEDVPGWHTDSLATDSGVETGWTPTDGDWTCFLKGINPFVWQLTDHTIAEADDIELVVDARITWAALTMEMFFFYDDNGTKIIFAGDDYELTEVMDIYGTRFAAAAFPQSIGKKLGIGFDNTTELADSWIGLDNVRLYNYNTTFIENPSVRPEIFDLAQNYPNPFNPETNIRYSLQTATEVTIDVYDVLGHWVNRLLQQNQAPGEYHISWDGRDFNGQTACSGIYFCRMQSGSYQKNIKMILDR
jgi:hypothetical protein